MIKEKIKKSLKKISVTGLAAAILASTIIAPKANAETSIYPIFSTSISQLQLNNKFLNNLNDEYSKNIRGWNLRPTWWPIEQAKVLNSVGIGIDVSLEKNLYFTANFSICSFNSIYDQSYIFTDPDYGDYRDRVVREEKNELSKYAGGIKLKKNLSDKVKLGISALVDFYNLNGSANLTRTKGTLGNPSSYTQLRTAKYSGGNYGLSAELDLSMIISRHFSAGLGIGYDSANVNTKGTETRKSSSSPNSIEKDYSPEYNLNGIRACLSVSYSFSF